MFSFEKKTLMRGRSLVPLSFLRTRQWRSCASLCFDFIFISPRIWPWANQLLLNRLAFLALDVFAHVTHAFAFVRLRRVIGTQLGSHQANDLFVGTFDCDLRIFFDSHLDLVRYGIINRVRIAEGHVHDLALDRGFETNALDL